MKVKTNILLAHPSSPRIQLAKNSVCDKEMLMSELGKTNYDYAIEQGWITEIGGKNHEGTK